MERKNPSSHLTERSSKIAPSAGKVLLAVFWDTKKFCCWTFWRLEPSMIRGTVTPCRNRKRRFGKCDLGFSDLGFCCWVTTRDHIRRRQRKTVLQLSVGSGNTIRQTILAPSDFYLFPPLKKNFAGRRFGSNTEVK
ncbi:hypothetical protein TNCV_492871 [Trichonephila clavipes]|nr:hypothetical protein TNCV_492871 [Trichonephila clavipes]